MPTTFCPNESWEYLPGRFVRRGDRIRITGGPIYRDAAGKQHRMGERGVFTFLFHTADRTGAEYIVASSANVGNSIVFLLKPRRSSLGLPGWKNRPYRFAKLRAAVNRDSTKPRTAPRRRSARRKP